MGSEQVSVAPKFYDVRDVAQMFQMSRMTVYRAIRGGELPAVRIRGRWLVPAKVIEALDRGAPGHAHRRRGGRWRGSGRGRRR